MASEWQRLGAVAPAELGEARLQLHWAAQILSASADAWLQAAQDDSHSNMEWRPEHAALAGALLPGGGRLALRVADLTLLVLGGPSDGATLPLRGETLAGALGWADAFIGQAAEMERASRVRDYDMPEHAVRDGAPFSAASESLEELARWYGNGDSLLRELAAGEPTATPIRCWPHHFDIAGIVYLDAPSPSARQLGFGLSPGDHYYAEPYFYVTPYPIPDGVAFPDLDAGGHWHRQGFNGAVQVGSKVVQSGDDAPAQHDAARRFLSSAMAAARTIIPASRP